MAVGCSQAEDSLVFHERSSMGPGRKAQIWDTSAEITADVLGTGGREGGVVLWDSRWAEGRVHVGVGGGCRARRGQAVFGLLVGPPRGHVIWDQCGAGRARTRNASGGSSQGQGEFSVGR